MCADSDFDGNNNAMCIMDVLYVVEFNNFDTITVGADKNFQNSSYFEPSFGNLKKIIVS